MRCRGGGGGEAEATQGVFGTGYAAGGSVTITNSFAYSASPTELVWEVLLPAGWTFLADAGSSGGVRPAVGTPGLLRWVWSSVPTSPVQFSYTVSIPADYVGTKEVSALVTMTQGAASIPLVARSAPLVVLARADQHSAYTTPVDGRISLFELTRVIELYNVRNGTTRTGCYGVAVVSSEDGFVAEPTRAGSAVVTLANYHSADTNRDGRLVELTRLIELFNTRLGTTRTGAYRVLAGSEDGFAPVP